jgi:hypothetical protein
VIGDGAGAAAASVTRNGVATSAAPIEQPMVRIHRRGVITPVPLASQRLSASTDPKGEPEPPSLGEALVRPEPGLACQLLTSDARIGRAWRPESIVTGRSQEQPRAARR